MPRPPDDDEQAFAEAMRSVRPLPGGSRRVTGGPTPSPRAARRPGNAAAPFEIESSADGVAGRARDVGAAVLRALRKGDPPPEARLDLHGRTREEGLRATEKFLLRARAEGRRAVLVIHGRGQNSDGEPVLRPALAEWLASAAAARAGVMAFAPAPRRGGGAGATVVLLRR